jgi:hypothetical protein
MPQLQVIEDPYASSTGNAINGLVGGGGIKAQAEAQELAARIKYTNAQQQHLAQQMRLEQQKFDSEQAANTLATQQSKDLQDSMGRYASMSTPRPSHPDGSPVSQQELDQWYARQNMNDQMARATGRISKGAEDLNKGYGSFMDNFKASAPPAPIGVNPTDMTDPNAVQVPQMPQGLSADAQKAWNTQEGKNLNETQNDRIASRNAAAKMLPQLLQMRDTWESANDLGGIGGVAANDYVRPVSNVFGSEAESRRRVYEATRQKILLDPAGRPKEGAVSNYEQKLYSLPFAAVDDTNAETGRQKMVNQFSWTLGNLGVPDTKAQEAAQFITHGAPRHIVDMLVTELQRGNHAAIDMFLDTARRKFVEQNPHLMNGGR